MCYLALKSNSYAALKQIPKELYTQKLFNRLLNDGKLCMNEDITDYVTPQIIIEQIEKGNIMYERSIPTCFQTEEVMLAFLQKTQKPLSYSTKCSKKVAEEEFVIAMNSNNIAIMLKRIPLIKDKFPLAFENLLKKNSRAIFIKGLTKEDLNLHLQYFPTNVLVAPLWYLEDHVRRIHVVEKNNIVSMQEKVSPIKEARVSKNFEASNYGEFAQLSLFDLFLAN